MYRKLWKVTFPSNTFCLGINQKKLNFQDVLKLKLFLKLIKSKGLDLSFPLNSQENALNITFSKVYQLINENFQISY